MTAHSKTRTTSFGSPCTSLDRNSVLFYRSYWSSFQANARLVRGNLRSPPLIKHSDHYSHILSYHWQKIISAFDAESFNELRVIFIPDMYLWILFLSSSESWRKINAVFVCGRHKHARWSLTFLWFSELPFSFTNNTKLSYCVCLSRT
jgi:hypothetical protein